MADAQQWRWKGRFFTIWSGQALSLMGSALVRFALIWWMTETTGSATVLAMATLVASLPPIVLGPLVGTLVDRWRRREALRRTRERRPDLLAHANLSQTDRDFLAQLDAEED